MVVDKRAAEKPAQPATSADGVFSEEHELFRETCRRFLEKELEPNYLRWEKDGKGTPAEFWRKAGDVGLVGMVNSD